MTADNLRKEVVKGALSRNRKNLYSQDSKKRVMVETGFGDCSSTVRHWYLKYAKIDIGLNTEAQIKSNLGKAVDMKITNGIPDESKMREGDLLYFRGTNDSRYLGVGHVEMYIGNSQLFGHGSGIGGTVKAMNNYCKNRQNSSSTSKLKNKGLINVVRFIQDDKASNSTQKSTIATNPSNTTNSLKVLNLTYIVVKDDTLSKIAKSYETNVSRVQTWNDIKNVNSISIGEKLIVGKYVEYKVKAGDNLSKISKELLGNANRYNEIKKFNGLKSDVINIGQVLKVKLE